MLRLKGQTESGEWVEFEVDELSCLSERFVDGKWVDCMMDVGENIYVYAATIQPAEDPRKQMLDEIRDTLKINLKNMDYDEWVEELFYEILDEMEAKL